MPVSGRLFDTRASATSISSVNSSSGRSGAIQRISLTPGEPSEAVRPMKPSNIIRIMIEQRCQPEPDSPFSIDLLAASSSRCIGCGSNSAAKARISSRVTRRGPNEPKRPGGKSSNVSVVMSGENEVRKPDCGRYLRQSQPGCLHGHARCRRASPAGTSPPLSGAAFRARQQPLNATHSFRFSWGNDRCSIFRTCFSGIASSRPRSSRRSTGS